MIVVLGERVDDELSSTLIARLDLARQLYTGGYMAVLGGRSGTACEADVMADYLIGHGIEDRFIIRERESTTTVENLSHLAAMMADERFPHAWVGPSTAPVPPVGPRFSTCDITIVTSGSHIRRTRAIARSFGLEATYRGAKENIWTKIRRLPRELIAYILWRVK